MQPIKILDTFQHEAEALASIIAIYYQPTRTLMDAPDESVVRLIAEALQCAYEATDL